MILNNRDFNSLNRFIEVFPEKEEEEEEAFSLPLFLLLGEKGGKGGRRSGKGTRTGGVILSAKWRFAEGRR